MSLFGNDGAMFRLSDSLKYVNDYETELYEDENGKTKERTIYIGPMIRFRDDKVSVKKKFISVLAMAIIEMASVLFAVFLEHTTAWWMFTIVPLTVSAITSWYLLMGALRLPFKVTPMKRDRYMHSVIRDFRSASASTILAITGLVAEVFYRVIYSDWMYLKNDFLFVFMVLLEIGMNIAIILVLRSINFDERELAKE